VHQNEVVSDELEGSGEVQQLIAAQRLYYDLRAPEYADVTKPSDRKHRGLLDADATRRIVNEFAPSGDVLELACGPGGFTRELVRHAGCLTAVDGSPRMLELNRSIVGDLSVEYVCADLFDWQPTRQYDTVFFGFWLSHVPPTHVATFWSLVQLCLRPGGRAGFVDEDERARVYEAAHSDAGVPTARRTLSDGKAFDVVKVFWNPPDLEQRLQELGWQADVEPLGEAFLYGVAQTRG
jgi:demethylmenaquinone methyltransferase/2-methoxy-6-polyprenyl-1,4-benzoquinol methylase